MTKIDCDTCGKLVELMWVAEIQWTGRCRTCGTIMLATKEEVTHD